MEVKQALNDGRFRDILPLDIRDDVAKYLHCPSCASNVPLYRKILKTCQKQLQEYFPGKEIFNEEEDIKNLANNNWLVINCSVNELESRLRALPKGRKQVAVCRWEDQCTVIINELDVLF
jgi:hypothetical protein